MLPTPNGSNSITMYTDGSCEPFNPGGYACWGWVAYLGQEEISFEHGCLGYGKGMTNNLAEYTAMVRALEWAKERGEVGVTIYTDSQLVVKQVNKEWSCNAENLLPLCEKAQQLVLILSAGIEWIPREKNTRADELSRLSYLTYKNLQSYTYYFTKIRQSKTNQELDKVRDAIKVIVPREHREFPLLIQAGKERRAEINRS